MTEKILPDLVDNRISFRPLQDDDARLLLRWLGDPDVSRWYGDGELSLVHIQARYAARIAGTDTTRSSIIQIEGNDVGYIQCYRLSDEPAYTSQLVISPEIAETTVATDLLIGESAYRNHGWGAPILRSFQHQIVFGEMKAEIAIIAPEPANLRAIRTYEKVGFAWVRTVTVVDEVRPENSGEEYVMELSRARFETLMLG